MAADDSRLKSIERMAEEHNREMKELRVLTRKNWKQIRENALAIKQ